MDTTKRTQRRRVARGSAVRRTSAKKTNNKPPSYYESIRKKRIYREGLIERMKTAREASGLSTEAVAAAIGIPHRRYLSYERNTEMRPWFWNSFCKITGADLGFLIFEHRPSARLEDDLHLVEVTKKYDGADSESHAMALKVLAETQRALKHGTIADFRVWPSRIGIRSTAKPN
jgi:hypothetical protein